MLLFEVFLADLLIVSYSQKAAPKCSKKEAKEHTAGEGSEKGSDQGPDNSAEHTKPGKAAKIGNFSGKCGEGEREENSEEKIKTEEKAEEKAEETGENNCLEANAQDHVANAQNHGNAQDQEQDQDQEILVNLLETWENCPKYVYYIFAAQMVATQMAWGHWPLLSLCRYNWGPDVILIPCPEECRVR